MKCSVSFLNFLILDPEFKVIEVAPKPIELRVPQNAAQDGVKQQVIKHKSDGQGGEPALHNTYQSRCR